MKTRWSVGISVESECTLDAEELWPGGVGRPEKPTIEDVKRELFGASPGPGTTTRVLQDMGMLDFSIDDVEVCIFEPVEVCDECRRPLGMNRVGHKMDCSQRGKGG